MVFGFAIQPCQPFKGWQGYPNNKCSTICLYDKTENHYHPAPVRCFHLTAIVKKKL